MALSSTSRPGLTGRILSRLPSTLRAIGGLSVSKLNGIWTIAPDFSQLNQINAPSLSDPSTKQIWVYDPITLEYNVLTLAALGDALYSATSTTSLSIGVGSKTFVTQTNKDFAVGSWVIAFSAADAANFMVGQVTAYVDTSLTVNMTAYGGSGTHADWTLRASSPPGSMGKSAGFSYLWSTDVTATDPTSGKIKANNATLSSVTALYVSETDHDGNAIAAIIASFDDGLSTIKGRLKIYDPVTPTNYAVFDVTGTNTDNGTWDTVNVSHVVSGGSLTDALAVAVMFTPKGDKGDPGGVPWGFDNSVVMADPGAGKLRLNNATIASATAIAISANSADTGNPSYSAWLSTFDDSTSSAHRGILTIRKASAPENFAQFDITGATTDNTTWLQLAVTYLGGAGSFTAGDQLSLTFARTGNAGAGDMTSANNLSDLANKQTARANLGVETGTGHGDSDYSILAADVFVFTNAAFTAARTWSLPAANSVNAGKRVTVADAQGTLTSTNTLIVSRSSTDTLKDGSSGSSGNTFTMSHAYETTTWESDGVSKWTKVENSRPHVRPDATANLTAGYTATAVNLGTKSTGTVTPDPTAGNIQTYTNGGAHTLAPYTTNSYSMMLDIINGASSGAITTSGFSKVTGDSFDTTATSKFRCFVSYDTVTAISHLHIVKIV